MRLLILALAVYSAGCSSVAPSAGEEAVLVRHPLIFGSGGVDGVSVKPGRKFVALTTNHTIVNMRPRQQEVAFDDLFTADGVPLDFHSAIQYQVTDAVKLVRDFGADDTAQGMGFFKRVLEQPFRMIVRDAVKKYGLNEMAIQVSAAERVDAEATERFGAVIESTGVPIKLLGITLGRANPPDAIKHQRVATAEQEQRVNTEKQRKLAEDQRIAAEHSRANADNAYREAMRLSPDQFLTLESIKIMGSVCMSKPGTCSFVTAGALPTFGIK